MIRIGKHQCDTCELGTCKWDDYNLFQSAPRFYSRREIETKHFLCGTRAFKVSFAIPHD